MRLQSQNLFPLQYCDWTQMLPNYHNFRQFFLHSSHNVNYKQTEHQYSGGHGQKCLRFIFLHGYILGQECYRWSIWVTRLWHQVLCQWGEIWVCRFIFSFAQILRKDVHMFFSQLFFAFSQDFLPFTHISCPHESNCVLQGKVWSKTQIFVHPPDRPLRL